MRRAFLAIALTLLCFGPLHLRCQTVLPGKNQLTIRSERQDVYFYPATSAQKRAITILFAPGDGGWRGFAVTIAQTLAARGYDVYGLDTKQYLESFTGKTTLQPNDVMSDFRQLAAGIGAGKTGADKKLVLAGWSEGAGLCLLAAASEQNRDVFHGLVTIGVPERNVLGWRWSDNLTYLTHQFPNEPWFASVDYLPKVSPLPLFMIRSSHDEYVSDDAALRLFASAKAPKQARVIEARNHRFDGATDEFFRVLEEGVQWTVTSRR